MMINDDFDLKLSVLQIKELLVGTTNKSAKPYLKNAYTHRKHWPALTLEKLV